jgi:hypothetical protein
MPASLIPPEDSIRVPIPLLSHLASRGSSARVNDSETGAHGI